MSLVLPTPLVSTDWLAAHLEAPGVRVLDASMYLPAAGRNARAEYAAGHIAGAVFADLEWLSDETAPVPHTLLRADVFAARIGGLGVGPDDAVVVYDGSGQHFSAPRLWWMLRIFGHHRVAVLDGGLRKWQAEGRALTTEVPVVAPRPFSAMRAELAVRDLAAMRANLETHDEQVVDARSAGRFTAAEPEPRMGVRGGHIPGSVNVHYASLVGADGTMHDAATLRGIFDGAGVDLAQPIVASCGTGVTACAVVLALDVLGVSQAAVYDGSWTEWGASALTPVETGAAPRKIAE